MKMFMRKLESFFYKINFLVFVFGFSLSCATPIILADKSVMALVVCKTPDIQDDLLYSIKGIGKYAKKNGIDILINQDSKSCGYKLKWSGKSEKTIDGVLTDYDLMVEMKSYFSLQN